MESIRSAIAASGDKAATIATLARDVSDCPSASKMGQLKPFAKGELDLAFERAAFALDAGALSPIVETASGFHVILRV